MDMTPERIDPVSGNDIPLGATAENVRDDIPAQLSEGEYVVPADVVNYYGVKFFEDLRMEAKEGFQEMAETGRIGGEPIEAPMDDSFPFDISELQVEDDVAGYSDGGLGSQYGQVGSYDLGSSYMQDYAPIPPVAPVAAPQVAAPTVSAPTTSTSSGSTSAGRSGPIITQRQMINPETGHMVFVKGYNTPGSTDISKINSGEDAFKPGFQAVDINGKPIDMAQLKGYEMLSSDDPRYQKMTFGKGDEQFSIPHPLAGVGQAAQRARFDPFNPQNIYRGNYERDTLSAFDQVKDFEKLSHADKMAAFDQRFGIGTAEGKAPTRIGMFGGYFGAGETNRMVDVLERDVIAYSKLALENPGAKDPETGQSYANMAAQARLRLMKAQNTLFDQGLDANADGREDSAGEKAALNFFGLQAKDAGFESRVANQRERQERSNRLRTYMGLAPTYGTEYGTDAAAEESARIARQVAEKVEGYSSAPTPDDFMAQRMNPNAMNQGGMARRGYDEGGMVSDPNQARKARVAQAVRRRRAQRAQAGIGELGLNPDLALLNPRQEAAPTTPSRSADNLNRLGNFFQSAGEAIGSVPDAIGSGLSRITGTPTPMQDLSATASEGLGVVGNAARAGLNMAGEGLDMLRSAPEAAVDMATDASRFLAAAPGNYANRVSGREASDAYQTGYEDGFAAGQRAAMAGIAKGDANTMLREARSQASAISAEQQAQGARDAASFDGAIFRYDDQLANQEAGAANMALLEAELARQADRRQREARIAASRQQRDLQQRSQDAARYERNARIRAEEEERRRVEAARRAEQEAAFAAQQEAERRVVERYAANRAQDRFESDAQLAAMYEANNQLKALLEESDDLERQQERLVNQYQSSAQGE